MVYSRRIINASLYGLLTIAGHPNSPFISAPVPGYNGTTLWQALHLPYVLWPCAGEAQGHQASPSLPSLPAATPQGRRAQDLPPPHALTLTTVLYSTSSCVGWAGSP